MGGLGPGIGGFEYLIIAIVALVVVGPERLPLMLRKLGQWVAKARRMADEFRSSFDEMARQSELDELRKEVEARPFGEAGDDQKLVCRMDGPAARPHRIDHRHAAGRDIVAVANSARRLPTDLLSKVRAGLFHQA